jgi:hypothetical protein
MKFQGFTVRADGRVELICEHGCGHPSKRLQEKLSRPWEDVDGVHGCCGCCSHEDFTKYEDEVLASLSTPKP